MSHRQLASAAAKAVVGRRLSRSSAIARVCHRSLSSTITSSPHAAPNNASRSKQLRPDFLPSSRPFSTTADADSAKESTIKEEIEFQAETRQLLDIVTHSLYTDKEVFLRELVSNASDALEKLRHLQVSGEITSGSDQDNNIPLEIRITTDEATNTLTITDTGVGMNREEMVSNLGTIARSGSKAFVKEMQIKEQLGPENIPDPFGSGIIGKFGVGFYSGFMVADKVDVRSKPADGRHDEPLVWESTGAGTYSISPLSSDVRQERGTSVVLHLRDDMCKYSEESTIESILKKYSNFVGFPIFLNGKRVNTIDAIWLHDPKEVDDEKHAAFYKYVSHMYDDPLSHIHFRMDAPIDIKALFYIPSFHQEKYGMGRMDPGVSLYCRKVLIEAKSPHILPDWCRFIKGVVDSEDLPLSISREKPQDTALVTKMRRALTKKIIGHLSTMMKKDTAKYKEEFYKEYSFFLKEGICQDYESQQALSKLLYFETSKGMTGELVSLDEYVSRCPPEQKDIYYLFAPSRELALQSPYMEVFSKNKREVLFIYSPIDDFVMTNLKAFEGRNLVNVDSSDIDSGDSKDADKDKDSETDSDQSTSSSSEGCLTPTQATEFCAWFQSTMSAKVSTCRTTSRLSSSPAVITGNESAAYRRIMRMVETSEGGVESGSMPLPKQTVEINPNHEIIAGLYHLKDSDPTLAQVLAEQIFDNCLTAAGLLDDGRSMLPRLNDLLLCIVKASVDKNETISENTEGPSSASDAIPRVESDSEPQNEDKNEAKSKD